MPSSRVEGTKYRMDQAMEFERAILEHPTDMDCRLAYADWLEERGDPQGKWIRTQITLDRMTPDHEQWPELVREDFELTQVFATRFREELKAHPIGRSMDFICARGAIEKIHVSSLQWSQHGDEIRATWPVRNVAIKQSSSGPLVKALNAEATSGLESLRLPRDMKAPMAKLVFPTARLETLERLSLRHSEVGQTGFMALAKHDLSRLTELDLTGNRIRAKGIAQLASMPWPQLKKLTLVNCALNDEDLFELGESNTLNALTHLNVGGNLGIHRLSGWQRLEQLRQLEFGNCSVDQDELRGVFDSSEMPNLNSLVLRRSNSDGAPAFTTDTLSSIGAFSNRIGLHGLSLAHQRADKEGVAALLEANALDQMRILDLSGNAIDDKLLQQILDAMPEGRLHRLGVASNRLSNAAFEIIAQAPALKRITHLSLANNRRLNDHGAKVLAESEALPNLVWFEMTSTMISEDGASDLKGRFGEKAIVAQHLQLAYGGQLQSPEPDWEF